ncbi:MAG: L-ribulose-5-phosphate 3-epimerase [Bacteroidetes bacterium]|nr:L-ribulose-5-phosphate 3-epimerase [Bacteroidota bacterium]
MTLSDIKLGIYEKALPHTANWSEKISLAESLGFQFIEISIDESDIRLARLDWSKNERKTFFEQVSQSKLTIPSMCFSGHRRFPLGSHSLVIRTKAREMMEKAIQLAVDTGIRTIQLAGYDVYYEESDDQTYSWFVEGLQQAVRSAARENVMLSMEIMDTPLVNSIARFMDIRKELRNPWFTVYPDIGNLAAWGNDVPRELELGVEFISAIHLKDTHKVTEEFPGQFREVPFGSGCVDFKSAFQTLHKLHYTGPFLIEMWTEKADDPIHEITYAKNWIIERMREGNYIV